MHDSQRCKFDFQGEWGEVGQFEKVRVCNWILLHGDKKNTVIERGDIVAKSSQISSPATRARSNFEIF